MRAPQFTTRLLDLTCDLRDVLTRIADHPARRHAKNGSAVALEALERIGAIYDVERSVSGKPPDERRRQQCRLYELSRPLAWIR